MPPTPSDDHPETNHEPPLQVLVVDDDPVQLRYTELVLARLGHDVTSAADGLDAVAIALARPFDAVLMDIDMPGMDGFTAARTIRDRLGAGGSPWIIALTSHVEDQSAFDEAGIDARLDKPCQIVDLRDQLDHVLDLRHGTGGRGTS